MEKARKILSHLAQRLSPILSLIIVVGIGIYASVRASALGDNFPFACFDGAPCLRFSTEARWFYGAVCTLVVIVWYQMRTQTKQQKETEDLLKATRTLVDTAPPKQLLHYTNERYKQARVVIDALNAKEQVNDHDFTYTIRVILNNMLAVASYWDTHQIESRLHSYRANVMLLYPSETFDAADQRQVLLRELRFADRNAIALEENCNHFQLYLRSATALNTSARLTDEEADASIPPLILGLNAPSEHGAQPKNLMPGAPFSLFYGRPQYLADTSSVVEKLKDDVYFDGLQSEITKFYREDGNAKSILSIPLFKLGQEKEDDWDAENHPYLGVVNIFRDAPGLLSGAKAADQYSALMAPMLDLLAQAVSYAMENDVELHAN